MSETQRILLITRHLAPLTGEGADDHAQADEVRRLHEAGHDVRAVLPAGSLANGSEGLSPLIEALMVQNAGHDHPVGVKVVAVWGAVPVYVLEGPHLDEREALAEAARAITVRLNWYPDVVLEGKG